LSGHRRTAIELALGALAISFAAIFFRLAEPTGPLLASALRLGIAALCLWPLARRRVASVRLKRAGVIAGLLYAIHFGTWVASLSRTSVAASVTLVTATPILLLVVALATGKDRPRAMQIVGIAVACLGVALIGGGGLSDDQLLGDGLALIGAAAMAGYLWLARSLGPELDSLALSVRAAGWGALFLCGAMLVVLPFETPVQPSAEALGWIVLAAVIPQVVGHTLLTSALRRATPTEVGLATAAEPVLSTLLAWLWLAELPTEVVLVGCAVALLGVVLGMTRRDETSANAAP
jgi:drug/metabolite transporter (DMT)-like permease